ncbi:serine hydrolase [Qipengyuania sp. CAU 1752]
MIRSLLTSCALGMFGIASTSAVPASAFTQAPEHDASQPDGNLAQRAADVVAVFKGAREAEEVFAESFLAAVPPTQLQAVNAQMTAQFGAVVGVDKVTLRPDGQADIAVRFERAIARGTMAVAPGPDGKIIGLLFNAFEPVDDSAAKITAELATLPGQVTALFAPLPADGAPVISLGAEQPLAIGSAFKLYVLSALAEQIVRQKTGWDRTVRLSARSFPSGMMQDWPSGSPVTVQTLATLMISISDNTATDQLIAHLGREAIEREIRASGHGAPDSMLPFLNTLELFALKGDALRGERFGQASESEQPALLRKLQSEIGSDRNAITPPVFTDPTLIDTVEWFASPADLRSLLRRVVEREDPTARAILAVNPSVSESVKPHWSYIGYKGGSEPGVLNLTWLLRDQDENWHILTLGWNNPDAVVNTSTLELFAMRILALPHS